MWSFFVFLNSALYSSGRSYLEGYLRTSLRMGVFSFGVWLRY